MIDMKMTCEEMLKEIRGLIGAPDNKILARIRRFIKLMNAYSWAYEQMRELLSLEYTPRDDVMKMKEEIEGKLSHRMKIINELVDEERQS